VSTEASVGTDIGLGAPHMFRSTPRERFRGGLVFKAHRLVYHSTLGLNMAARERHVGDGLGGGDAHLLAWSFKTPIRLQKTLSFKNYTSTSCFTNQISDPVTLNIDEVRL